MLTTGRRTHSTQRRLQNKTDKFAVQLREWLVQFDAIAFRVLDPGEPAVIKVLSLLDRDSIGPQLVEKPDEIPDPVVDHTLAALGRQDDLRIADRKNGRVNS